MDRARCGLVFRSAGLSPLVLSRALREAKLRISSACLEPLVVAREVLGVDEHAEAAVEVEFLCCRVLLLLLPGVGHRAEAQRAELVDGWLIHHAFEILLS